MQTNATVKLDVIVIGAGQAGLSVAFHLEKAGLNYIVIEKEAQIGTSWLSRWDSLKLFTPCPFNDLEGFPFPCEKGEYPSKNAVAAYLQAYAEHFKLRIAFNERVVSIDQKNDGEFETKTSKAAYKARALIVATGAFSTPHIPEISNQLADDVFQLHSSQYLNPQQIPSGGVLVIGGGNSGVQISAELAKTHKTYLSILKRRVALPSRLLGKDPFWWLDKFRIVTVNIPPFLRSKTGTQEPIIGTSYKEIAQSGVSVVGRTSTANGYLVLAEQPEYSFKNVIWATGFRPNFNWINIPNAFTNGRPKNLSPTPGLFFIGLPATQSALLGGVKHAAKQLFSEIQAYLLRSALSQ